MVISEELMKAVKPFVDLAYAAQDVDMVAYNDDEELALHAIGAWSGSCVTNKQCRDLMSAYKNAKSALELQGQALRGRDFNDFPGNDAELCQPAEEGDKA